MNTASPGDGGHVAIEAAIAVIGLLGVMWLFIGGLRLTNAQGDVHAAARSAARAAAVAGTGDRRAAAATVAADTLADRGVACRNLAVGVDEQAASPRADRAGVVVVSVGCTVELGDVALAGFAGTKRIEATAVATIDVFRGGS